MASPQLEHGYTRIANEILEALARHRLSGQQRCILDLIIRESYGRQAKEARMSYAEIATRTGIARREVMRNLKTLTDELVVKIPPPPTSGKNPPSYKTTFILQKDYHLWSGGKIPTSGKNPTSKQGKNPTSPYIVVKDKEKERPAPGGAGRDPAIGRLNKLFYELLELKVGKGARHNFAQSGSEFKRLLRGNEEITIASTIKNFFDSSDTFIVNKAYSWGAYVTHFNALKSTGGPIHVKTNQSGGSGKDSRPAGQFVADAESAKRYNAKVER